MIHSVLIFNKDSLPRLMRFYTPLNIDTQLLLVRQVFQLISQRPSGQCSFLTPPPLLEGSEDIRVIYRHYATLYFVFIVDDQESELGILDLIHVFVKCLDQCFPSVSELDLVFGWQLLETVLDEIIQGGIVIDTNMENIIKAVDDANSATDDANSGGAANANTLVNMFSTAISQISSENGSRRVWGGL